MATRILIFDTETDGFPNDRVGSDDPKQVHVVELGAILAVVDDHPAVWDLNVAHELNLVVDSGYPIPEQASDVHGITTDTARHVGVGLPVAMRAFGALLQQADIAVAYNLEFDQKVLGHAVRQAFPGRNLQLPSRTIDPMHILEPICALPPTAKQRRYYPNKKHKRPKLEEAYRHAFDTPMQCAHSAIGDCRATLELLEWLVSEGHLEIEAKGVNHG